MTTNAKKSYSKNSKSSVSETGHNKNVANFSTAYQILEEMGDLYKPSNENLKLINISPIITNLAGVMTVLNEKKPIYKNAVADREVEMAPIGKIATKALNFAKSLDISKTDKQYLQSQTKKIRGDSKPKTVNPDTAEVETISTSQLSYDNRIANLATYTSQLASHPEYIPNETDIQITSLQSYFENLKTLSSKVNAAGNELITARKKRNDILYNNPKNVLQLIKEIKSYVKSLAPDGEPYYKALVKLQFRDSTK